MDLRPYQRLTINMTWDWLRRNTGHPCIVLPTGAGKSVVIAELCREAVQNWGARILMLSHVAELLVQNQEKIIRLWPNAPVGMYSASLNRRDIDAITFAGIQSIRGKAELIGHVDLVIIDEAHTVGHKDEGTYREFLADLERINPSVRIIGLTATPYRLGHGMITDKPAIFDDLITPVTVIDLINHGYLARLDSKHTIAQLSTEGVHKRGGEWIESELQAAMDTADNNTAVVREIIEKAGYRRSWLVFCSGVTHAEHIAQLMREYGITAEAVTGETTNRGEILGAFRSGDIRCLTSVGVLTTGFDHPGIDLIAFLRPTMSKGLYCQMAGRGLRLKPHTDHCLILDFAGLVEMHGPITALSAEYEMPKKDGEPGDPPCKVCPECGEIVFISTMICPKCDYSFPVEEKKLVLHNDDIMGDGSKEMTVTGWKWAVETSKKGIDMIVITFYGAPLEDPIKEYLCVWHDGFAGEKGRQMLAYYAKMAGVEDTTNTEAFEAGTYPTFIKWVKDGKYRRIVERNWEIPF